MSQHQGPGGHDHSGPAHSGYTYGGPGHDAQGDDAQGAASPPPPPAAPQSQPYPQASPGYAPGQPSAGEAAPAQPDPQHPYTAMPMGSPNPAGTAQLRSQMSSLGITNPLPALIVSAAAYVAALVTAVIVLILTAIGITIAGSSSGDLGGTRGLPDDVTDAFDGIASLIRLPFELVAMACFGTYGAGGSIPLVGDVAFGVHLLPALVTAAICAVCWLGGRQMVRRTPGTGVLGAALSSVLAGLLFAIVTTLIARIAAQPLSSEEIDISLHAAGFGTFFGAFMLVTLFLLLGQLSAMARPAWWPLVDDLAAAARLAAVHALLFSVVTGTVLWLVVVIQALQQGNVASAFALLFWLPLMAGYAIAWLCGLGALGSLGVSIVGSMGVFSYSRGDGMSMTMFSMPWYVWLIALVLGLASLAVMSIIWGHGRRMVPGNVLATIVSWVALPVAYFAGGLLLMLLGWAGVSMTAGSAASGGAGVYLQPWLPFLTMLAGVIIEVLSRFAVPLVAAAVPGPLVGWFRSERGVGSLTGHGRSRAAAPLGAAAGAAGWGAAGTATAFAAPEEHRSGSSVVAAPIPSANQAAPMTGQPGNAWEAVSPASGSGEYATVPVAGAPAAAERRPLSRRAKRGIIGGVIVAGALLMLIIGGAIAVSVLSSTVYGPDNQVDSYLSAVEKGQWTQAAKDAPPNTRTGDRVLLTDAVAAKTKGRIDSHTIDKVDVKGKTATVTATVTQDGVRSQRTYTLTRTGSTMLVFPTWKLADVEYPMLTLGIPQGATAVTVNGVKVDVSGVEFSDEGSGYRVAQLPVNPGVYSVGVDSPSKYLDVKEAQVTVPADGSSDESGDDMVAAPTLELNKAGQDTIRNEVKKKVDACAASTSAEPENCPFSTYASSNQDGSTPKVSWSISAYPQVEIEASEDGTWNISTPYENQGTAAYSYSYTQFDGTPSPQKGDDSFLVSGTATIADDGSLQVDLEG